MSLYGVIPQREFAPYVYRIYSIIKEIFNFSSFNNDTIVLSAWIRGGRREIFFRQAIKRKTMPKRVKAAIAIVGSILLALGIFFFLETVTKVNRSNPDFSYISEENREGPVQLITGEKVEIPFGFNFDEGVSRVNLEFSGIHKNIPGIAFSNTTVAVKKGKAQAKVILQITSDEDLKAGSHVLTIIAKDADSGMIISEGEILLNFNMLKVIAGCSC
jgi:hypothetical protein